MDGALKAAAICGTFDVRNYGDLLFPLVARHRLADLATEGTTRHPITLFDPRRLVTT